MTRGPGGSEGLCCDTFQEAEVTHSDPPLRRNHFAACSIWEESHRKSCKTKASTSDLLSGPSATNGQIHHLKERLAQQFLLLLLRFLLRVQELSQGRRKCCRKTEGKPCTKEPPMQCNANIQGAESQNETGKLLPNRTKKILSWSKHRRKC